MGDWIILAMVLLQVGAMVSYTLHKDYHEAVLWLGGIIGNLGYLMMRWKG